MGVRRNFSREEGNLDVLIILFRLPASDVAMQMDFHKKLYTFYTTKKMLHVTGTVSKIALRW